MQRVIQVREILAPKEIMQELLDDCMFRSDEFVCRDGWKARELSLFIEDIPDVPQTKKPRATAKKK